MYQVLGDGPRDLLYFYGMGSHIEFAWESRAYAEFYMRLASFSRLIMFDRRGTGSSDGISLTPRAIPTWEEWTEDIVAVLGAAGITCAWAILAASDSGPIAILLAAMRPELVSALVLFNSTARYLEADDYPIGAPPEAVDATVQLIAGLAMGERLELATRREPEHGRRRGVDAVHVESDPFVGDASHRGGPVRLHPEE